MKLTVVTTAKTFRAIASIAARESSRYALQGVCIRPGRMEATDGRRLIIYAADTQGEDEHIVDSKEGAAAAQTMRKLPHFTIRPSPNSPELTSVFDGGTITVDVSSLDGTFPDTHNLLIDIGVNKPPSAEIVVDADLLVGLLLAMPLDEKRGRIVRLSLHHTGSTRNPYLGVTDAAGSAIGVLSGCKPDETATVAQTMQNIFGPADCPVPSTPGDIDTPPETSPLAETT
jgi:hypothetical protein